MARNKKHHKNKTSKIIVAAFVLLVATGFLYLRHVNRTNANDAGKTDEQSTINYNPPTEQEQKSGDIKKQEIADEDNQTQAELGNNKKTANVIITDAAQYDDAVEVRAFINNDFKEGTCKITFKKGTLSLTKSAPAYPDATTTICTVPDIKRSEFAESGNWQLTVTYTSDDAKGSATQEVAIN